MGSPSFLTSTAAEEGEGAGEGLRRRDPPRGEEASGGVPADLPAGLRGGGLERLVGEVRLLLPRRRESAGRAGGE